VSEIATLKSAILLCREAELTAFLHGTHGIGKSSLVRDLAQERGWGFIDFRLSQIEGADLRGLPDRRDDGRTHFCPPAELPVGDLTTEGALRWLGPEPAPEDLPARRTYEIRRHQLQPRLENGILFLDEFNRAQDDTLNAAFQLVLDRAVGSYVLPPGWSIVAAGNPDDGYCVNSSAFEDKALVDRFCHLTMKPGPALASEWAVWMRASYGPDAESVVDFVSSDLDFLYGKSGTKAPARGFAVEPTPRSWAAVARVLKGAGRLGISGMPLQRTIAGLVGTDLAASFKKYKLPVRPADLLASGVKALEGKLNRLTREQLIGLIGGLSRLLSDRPWY
jgi:hypothetical protein